MKSLADIRKEYPQYADVPDDKLAQALHAKFYSDMPFGEFAKAIGLSAAPQAERGIGGTFTGGVARSWEGTKGLLTEALPGLVRGALGDEEGARRNLAQFQARTEAAEKANPTQVTTEDLLNNFSVGKLGQFIVESTGEALPSLATALIPGIGGGAIAARVGAGAAMQAGSKELAKRVAVGQLAGVGVGSAAQNIPESFAGLNENADQPLSIAPALAAGVAKSVLDMIGPTLVLRRFGGKEIEGAVELGLKKFIGSRAGATAFGAVEQLLTEGATEAAQEAIDQIAQNIVRDKEYSPVEILGAGLKGGLGSMAPGAVAGLRGQGVKNEESRVAQEAADADKAKAEAEQQKSDTEFAAALQLATEGERARAQQDAQVREYVTAEIAKRMGTTPENVTPEIYEAYAPQIEVPADVSETNPSVRAENTLRRLEEARRQAPIEDQTGEGIGRTAAEIALQRDPLGSKVKKPVAGPGEGISLADLRAAGTPSAEAETTRERVGVPLPEVDRSKKLEDNVVDSFLSSVPAGEKPSIYALQRELLREVGPGYTVDKTKALIEEARKRARVADTTANDLQNPLAGQQAFDAWKTYLRGLPPDSDINFRAVDEMLSPRPQEAMSQLEQLQNWGRESGLIVDKVKIDPETGKETKRTVRSDESIIPGEKITLPSGGVVDRGAQSTPAVRGIVGGQAPQGIRANPAIEPRPADMSRNLPQNPPQGMSQDLMNAWVDRLDATPEGTPIKFEDFKKAGVVTTPKQQATMLAWARDAGLVNDRGIRVLAGDRVSKRGEAVRQSPLAAATAKIESALPESPRAKGKSVPRRGPQPMLRPADRGVEASRAANKLRAEAKTFPAPVAKVLEQEADATEHDAAVRKLIEPLARTTEDVASKTPVWEAPPKGSMNRMTWFNRVVSTLDYNATKYKELQPYKKVVELRDTITQQLRRSFTELMHPFASLKNNSKVNMFSVLANQLGAEANVTKNADGTLSLTIDPAQLDQDSFLRSRVKAPTVISLNKEESAAYNDLRKAFDLERAQRRKAMLVGYGVPVDVTPAKLQELADAEKARSKTLQGDDRKNAQARARNLTRMIGVIEALDAPGFRDHYLPNARPQGENVVEFTAKHSDGRVQYFRVDSPIAVWDAERRGKELQAKVAKRLGPDWKMSGISQSTPDSLITQFRQSKDISAFNVVDTLTSLMRTGANQDKVDAFLDDLAEMRQKVQLTGTVASRSMNRKGTEGWVHEGNFDRYVEQVAADTLSRAAASIGHMYTKDAHAQVLADLGKLADKSFLTYATQNSEYANSAEAGVDFLRATAFHYTLGFNISSAILNSMQLLQTTFPVLGATYGYTKTGFEMGRAMTAASKMGLENIRKRQDIFSNKTPPTGIEPALWADLRTFISRAGANPITADQQGGFGGGQNLSPLEAKFGKNAEKIGQLSSRLFSAVEEFNRVSTFIASWRLANSNKSGADKVRKWAATRSPEGQSALSATTGDLASFIVDQTQYNMSKAERPRFMQGALGIPFQFSAYPLRTMELMAKQLTSVEGKSWWTDPVARRMFIGMVGMTWMQAGVLGLPLVGAAANWWDEVLSESLSKMLGVPVPQVRKTIQAGMAEIARETGLFDDPVRAANVILKGPAREASGIALEKRVALDWPSPDMFTGNWRDALGPFGGAVIGAGINSAEFFSRDQPTLALLALLPPVFRNAARAEFSTPMFSPLSGIPEGGLGFLSAKGNVPLGPDQTPQGLVPYINTLAGFESTKVADAREAMNAMGSKMLQARKDELFDTLAQKIVEQMQFDKSGNKAGSAAAQKRFDEIIQRALAADARQTDPQKMLLTGDVNASIKQRVFALLYPLEAKLKAQPKTTRGSEFQEAQQTYGQFR